MEPVTQPPTMSNLTPIASPRNGWRDACIWLVQAFLFGLVLTQPWFYFSNQHQYYLHGLALANVGQLSEDWLANTADPTPIFSRLLAGIVTVFGTTALQLPFILLAGLYLSRLQALFTRMTGWSRYSQGGIVFTSLIVITHSGAIRRLSATLFGIDFPWYLQSGVAGQYILGAGWQPSTFGTFLLAAVVSAMEGRRRIAALWIGLGCTLHATYLLPGAMLVLGMLVVDWRERGLRSAAILGCLSLASVLPVIGIAWSTIAPSSPETFAEAQDIIARTRIPHHAQMTVWLNKIAWGQIVWMGLGIAALWGTRWFPLLAVPGAIGFGLSVWQGITDSNGLALLFPWRISILLMPLATAILLTKMLQLILAHPWARHISRPGIITGTMIMVIFAGLGIWLVATGRSYREVPEEKPLLRWILEHRQPGQIYLVPLAIPQPSMERRGVVSTSFTPAPRAKPGQPLIPVDLQAFRLECEVPIYIDYKSIPYRDVEVLEWYSRLMWVDAAYKEPDWVATGIAEEVKRRGITHVVAPSNLVPQVPNWETAYSDLYYTILLVK
ncbi:DUF6798 domain-containing protein [Tuwongella immobilis]|uniref:DUF6798 domain-containing protein n=1 Tax=Tuwongella immobilis TaxID=692036 RepID=A0A6C2YSW2_9BACT|nr:DUF6798 domain-containing protein [Tuwongella immobilis]VIP04818.1 Uncharacterized protein OS=Trichodesmium erythraeum (strain IMS101) GN=Tery_2635 PE=4 SV=1 [Tuwongella immobilis]VTS06996.1 Uncharacterized protein OS=Trichodesmium erythraeum (strain IMS101) GN=Tery_2635 PE=4 SV=1 [Tuwongella immobilis]